MNRSVIVLLCGASLLACATRVAEPERRRAPRAELEEPARAKKELEGQEAKGPSWALLRKFAAGHAPDLVSARPIVFVTVGPSRGPGDNDGTVDVDQGHVECHDVARRLAAQAVNDIWAYRDNAFDLDELSLCEGLSCTKPPQGEWDDEVHFTFVRTGDDRLVLQSVVRVLDVPVRIGADEDRTKAMKKAAALEGTTQRCPAAT